MPLFLMRPTTEIYEIPHTRENFVPTKYPRQKTLDSRNTHKKKFVTPQNTHEKKFGTHEIPTKARWHNGTRPTRRTMAHRPRNLAHSNDSFTHSLAYSLIYSFAYSLAHFLTNSPTLPCLIVGVSNKMNKRENYQNFLKFCGYF